MCQVSKREREGIGGQIYLIIIIIIMYVYVYVCVYRAGNALMAERYLIAMKQRGFVPDHQTYHQLLRAYAM